MAMFCIDHVNLVLKESILDEAYLLIEDGYIRDFGRSAARGRAEAVPTLDGRGLYLGPGLIDIHTHAGGGHWFHEEPEAAARAHLRAGTTTVFPALYVNLSRAELIEAGEKIMAAARGAAGRNIGGLYMEAPYLSPKYGCELSSNRWAGPIDPAEYRPLLAALGPYAAVWCLAPEREGIADFVREARAASPQAVFAVAHSEAGPEEIEPLIDQGLSLATHHTNASGARPKYPECRPVGVDEVVWYRDELFAELICDTVGIHVDPYMIRLIRKIKGDGRLILVSDAFVSDAPAPPGYERATDINFDAAGEIAGTKLTLSVACRNMLRHSGCGLCAAFRYASTNPAAVLGLGELGEIAPGKKADLILVDGQFTVKEVFKNGAAVKG